MRKEPKLLVLVLLLISIVFAFSIGGIEKNATTSLTYPATVCPGNLSDGSNSVFLPNSKINIASIPSKLGKLKGASSANLNSNKPLLIDGGNVTSLVVTKSAAGGLGASIWTDNLKKAEHLSKQIESGIVTVNNVVISDPRVPFGGIKQSGFGRELSKYGMLEFVNIKSIRFYDQLIHHHYVE